MSDAASKKQGPGRPAAYAPQVADEILQLLAEGLSLSEICRREDMPARSTVNLWVAHDTEGFADRYARARDAQAERYAEEIIEISDDGTNDWVARRQGDETITAADHEHIQRSKLRVDSRKWLMARMAPKRYGDRMSTELTGKDGAALIPTTLDDRELAQRIYAGLLDAGIEPDQARKIAGL